MQAVILAGGLGTRLRPITNALPKGLVPINGRPFLELKVEQLKANGVGDVVLCVGYLGDLIEKHFGDGSSFGVRIRYSRDGKTPLGPIGALKKAGPLLDEEFFVTYGDNYLRFDYRKMMSLLRSSGKMGVLAVFHNRDAYGKSDVDARNGRVVAFQKGSESRLEWINFGIYALRKGALQLVAGGRFCEERELFDRLISGGELLSYEVTDRFYEIGNMESLTEFEKFVAENTKPSF